MERKAKISSIFWATTSFIGGVAVGLLLSPKSGNKNRIWLSDHTAELAYWLNDRRKSATDKSSKELQQFRKNVQQGIRQNIPDLYEATEDLDLNNNDIHGE